MAHAEEPVLPDPCDKEVFFGHNLTHTSNTLCKGKASVGIQALAVGLSDNFTLGTSPWILVDYKTFNFALRWKALEKRTYELIYFKSCFNEDCKTRYRRESKGYVMEAIWLTQIEKYAVNDHYNVYINYGVQYYFDQTSPFSLKRPASNVQPWQFHLTSLHEIHMFGPMYWSGEVGALIPTDTDTYFHFGSALGFRKNHFSTHLGFSFTTKLSSILQTKRVDNQGTLESYGMSYYDENDSYIDHDMDYSIHPEFTLQYQF